MTPLDLRRYRAERLLRKNFEGMRGKVLTVVRSQLRGKGIALAAADLEACYAQAWHGLYASVLEGERVENPAGWLVRVTFRRAVDEHRAARATGVTGEGEGKGSYPPGSHAARDWAGELDDKARLRHVFEGMRTRLGPREREAASLCYLQGLSRAEAAERMGVSEARMRKLIEGADARRPGVAAKLGELLGTIAAGGWCEEQGSLMKAYAFGILDPDGERYALAAAHCRQCPACRARVASLRGLASVLPLPLLPELTAVGNGIGVLDAGAANRGRGGLGSVRRAATGASRMGGRLGGGLSGPQGSLVAKLAIAVMLVLGTGYAVMGSRAHGGTSAPRTTARPLVGKPLRPATRALHGARAHTHRAVRSSTRRRPSSTPATSSTGRAPVYEFGPERVTGRSLPARISSTRAGAGEFGLE